MKITETQRRVLEWLMAFPEVEISANPPFSRPQWTMWWADETARLHMIKTCRALGGMGEEKAESRWAPPSGSTPRLTTQTFNALHLRRLICAKKHRPQQGVWAEMYWYQISSRGERLLLEELAAVGSN